jgi:hypothetical protein
VTHSYPELTRAMEVFDYSETYRNDRDKFALVLCSSIFQAFVPNMMVQISVSVPKLPFPE